MLKDRIERDLKAALLTGDKQRVEVLRGLKSAILYEELAKGARSSGLAEDTILSVIARESKKRAESAEIYRQADATERADTEMAEKAIIDMYLPLQLTDAELEAVVGDAIAEMGDALHTGKVIGLVRQKVGARADGNRIAAAVNKKIAK